MSEYIFFVGKPYPKAYELSVFERLGYKVGVFLDKAASLKHQNKYDAIVPVDFTSPQTIVKSLDSLNVTIKGLLCTYESYLPAKAILGNHLRLLTPNFEAVEKCTDKYIMRQAFDQIDPSMSPRFASISTKEELLQASSNMHYPVILKPTNLVKSLLVIRCNDESELIQNYEHACQQINQLYKKHRVYSHQPRFIIEEYINGRTCSVAAFVDQDGNIAMCKGITALVNAHDIDQEDNYIFARQLPGEFTPKLKEKIFEIARKGAQAVGAKSTPLHIEIIYNDTEVKLIEIGARIGGYRPRMYQSCYGIDLIEQEINVATGKLVNLEGKLQQYSGVFEFFPKTQGQFKNVENLPFDVVFDYFKQVTKDKPVGPARDGYKAAAIGIVTAKTSQELESAITSLKKVSIEVTP